MRVVILEFLAFCGLAGCGVWWLAARIGPPPKPKPQITPWHPERGREARPLLVFYLVAYGPVFLFFLAWAGHGAHRF